MDSVEINNFEKEKKSLYWIGGICAILQIAALLVYAVVLGVLGPKPATAAEYFAVYQESPLAMALRGDFLMLILIGLYLGTFPALYAALKRYSPIYTTLAVLFTGMAVVGTIATESTFSLLRLAEMYAAAANDAARAQLTAAGEAVIAADMWNSSGAYMVGILLQGSGVLISVIMLRSKDFHKMTAWAGIMGNGFDLIQHLLHPFSPGLSGTIKQVMGVFYLVWYPMLAWDLVRLARRQTKLAAGV